MEAAASWLSVKLQDLTADTAQSHGLKVAEGALITEVVANGPGASAGLKPDDVILQIGDTKVTNARGAAILIAGRSPDTSIDITVWRAEAFKTIAVRLGKLPQERAPAPPLPNAPATGGQSGFPSKSH